MRSLFTNLVSTIVQKKPIHSYVHSLFPLGSISFQFSRTRKNKRIVDQNKNTETLNQYNIGSANKTISHGSAPHLNFSKESDLNISKEPSVKKEIVRSKTETKKDFLDEKNKINLELKTSKEKMVPEESTKQL